MGSTEMDSKSRRSNVESVRERLTRVGLAWSVAHYELVMLVVDLDESGEWIGDGTATSSHWVAQALDVELCTAREWLRIGRALINLPFTSAAFEAGLLSFSKVRVLTRVATRETEQELLDLAHRTPAGRLTRAVARWLADGETPDETAARQHAARGMSWRVDADGMVAGSFRLPPVVAARVVAAIDAEVARTVPDPDATAVASDDASRPRREWPTMAQQRADALVALVSGGGFRTVSELVFHVRGDGLSFDDGTPIPWSELGQIVSQAFVRALIHDADGRPINASARRRHPTVRQQRLVKERDRCCVDCGSTELLQYDHVPEFERSGQTVVEELELRCAPCHHRRHASDGDSAS